MCGVCFVCCVMLFFAVCSLWRCVVWRVLMVFGRCVVCLVALALLRFVCVCLLFCVLLLLC